MKFNYNVDKTIENTWHLIIFVFIKQTLNTWNSIRTLIKQLKEIKFNYNFDKTNWKTWNVFKKNNKENENFEKTWNVIISLMNILKKM